MTFMKKKHFLLIALMCLASFSAVQAQEEEGTPLDRLAARTEILENSVSTLSKFKISGYVQAQYQSGQRDASLKAGTGKNATEDHFNRFGIRRARVKIAYTDTKLGTAVFQVDLSDDGSVKVKDAYYQFTEPVFGVASLKAGIYDRPFGNEISYSSSRRESPERSTVTLTLFPDEREVGGMLILQAPKGHPLNFLKLEAGLFGGNGIAKDNDNKKDFIGHLSATKTNASGSMQWGLGTSLYYVKVYQGTANVYTLQNKQFVLSNEASNLGDHASRKYFGLDGQLTLTSPVGLTNIRSEYLFGTQPGTADKSGSPKGSTLPSADTYIRDFNGGYVYVVQDIATTKHSLVLKYDWYDPNTKVEKQEALTKGDQTIKTYGLGYLYRMNSAVRLMVYYDAVKGEKTAVSSDKKDNLWTVRLQYKF